MAEKKKGPSSRSRRTKAGSDIELTRQQQAALRKLRFEEAKRTLVEQERLEREKLKVERARIQSDHRTATLKDQKRKLAADREKFVLGEQKRKAAQLRARAKLQLERDKLKLERQRAELYERYPELKRDPLSRNRNVAGRHGMGAASGAFGGWAFGARYGTLSWLGGKGAIGKLAGGFMIFTEIAGNAFKKLLLVTAKFTMAAGAAVAVLGQWYSETVSFNQQTNKVVEALVGGRQELAKEVGRYIRRRLAREMPFTTRETAMMAPQFWSIGRTFKQGNFLTQLTSDIAFGLNMDNPRKAAPLVRKAIQDVIAAGKLRGEEIRQLSNLGIPIGMLRQNIMRIWNTPQFQKMNPKAGKLGSLADVVDMQKAGKISSNLALNAIAATTLQRLRRRKVGEYSQWATMHTLTGLESQVKSLPIEIMDMIARKGGSPGKYMSLLQNLVTRFGSLRSENQAAVMIDEAIESFLEFPKELLKSFNGFKFLLNITKAIQEFDWGAYGQFVGEFFNWLGEAFRGFMQAAEMLRPIVEDTILGFAKATFGENATEIAENLKNLGLAFLFVARAGAAALSLLNMLFQGPTGVILSYLMGAVTPAELPKSPKTGGKKLTPEGQDDYLGDLFQMGSPSLAWGKTKPKIGGEAAGMGASVTINQEIHAAEGDMHSFADHVVETLMNSLRREGLIGGQ